MRSEALDITIESRGPAVWLVLSGPFHNEQVPNIREKIAGLLEEANRQIVVDLEQVTDVGDQVVPLFLQQLSIIKGKGGSFKLVFRNKTVSDAFGAYRNVFRIYPDAQAASRGSVFDTLRLRRELLSRRTGVRLSRPVALFLLFVLCGWFLSLVIIIALQNERIRIQERELQDLTQWKQRGKIEIATMRERLRPMEQLGIIHDSLTDSMP